MSGSNEVPLSDNDRKMIVAESLSNMHLVPVPDDGSVNLSRSTKIPFGELASLGGGFAAILESFRTVTETVETAGSNLMYATDAAGHFVAYDKLQQFNDGSGGLGSIYVDGKFQQLRWHQAASQISVVTTTLPVDPATMAMAVALVDVNVKLDHIQDTLNDVFDFLKEEKRAKLRESLETLSTISRDYRFNADRADYRHSKYVLIQDINRDAIQAINMLRSQLLKKLGTRSVVELGFQVEQDSKDFVEILQEYQLAVYLYGLSTFLGVILNENFDSRYLLNKGNDIRQKNADYLVCYFKCEHALMDRKEKALDNLVLDSADKLGKGLGSLVEGSPIGGLFKGQDESAEQVEKAEGGVATLFEGAKETGSEQFIKNIETVDRLYNYPNLLFTDGESLFLLPVEEEKS